VIELVTVKGLEFSTVLWGERGFFLSPSLHAINGDFMSSGTELCQKDVAHHSYLNPIKNVHAFHINTPTPQ
jgi:hypothetical protein